MNNNSINWNEIFKIRLRKNASIKHEVIKTILTIKLKEKYAKQLKWIRVYSEFEVENQEGQHKITDIYFENIKTKEVICYEIQNQISENWKSETTKFYESFDKYLMKTDWILIPEKEFSDDIEEIKKKLEEYI